MLAVLDSICDELGFIHHPWGISEINHGICDVLLSAGWGVGEEGVEAVEAGEGYAGGGVWVRGGGEGEEERGVGGEAEGLPGLGEGGEVGLGDAFGRMEEGEVAFEFEAWSGGDVGAVVGRE